MKFNLLKKMSLVLMAIAATSLIVIYLLNGGSLQGALIKLNPPAGLAASLIIDSEVGQNFLVKLKRNLSKEESQVISELGYSNDALAKALIKDRVLITKVGVSFPTGFSITNWGGFDQEPDEYQVSAIDAYKNTWTLVMPTGFNLIARGSAENEGDIYQINRVDKSGIDWHFTSSKSIGMETVKLKIKATFVGKDGCGDIQISYLDGEYKLCLKQNEEIVIPVSRSELKV